ncbi:hypothetical protein KQI77_10240 [Clostridium sp. MSJ-8]|uniref:hypothetical protein n=1 Tax=Clostridium sp. MSJ-8 TaxID=2841510 RepID=UPI001C0F12E7|nr:hypothetical protein [Clostridium sp. MSJ-8]MBU5488509.1 hypothetical protein [Clostridium sp. MSJ-8]
MFYLTSFFTLNMINDVDDIQYLKMTKISKHDVKKLIDSREIVSLCEDTERIEAEKKSLGIEEIKYQENLIKIKPEDLLIVLHLMEDNDIEYIKIELSADWKVDYYTRKGLLLKHIDLGNTIYEEAKRKAFLAGVGVEYDVYDIYYQK